MAATKVYGYQLTLLIGGKLIKGLVTTGLSIKPNFEESILKEDNGVAQKEFKDADLEMTFAGKTIEMDSSESTSHEDFETIRSASMTGAKATFSYGRRTSNDKLIVGEGYITAFSENAGSEKVLGDFSGTISAKSGDISETEYPTTTAATTTT
jgi:hypothetical protein